MILVKCEKGNKSLHNFEINLISKFCVGTAI